MKKVMIVDFEKAKLMGYENKIDNYQRGLLKEILNDSNLKEIPLSITTSKRDIEYLVDHETIDAIVIDKGAYKSTELVRIHKRYPDIKIIFKVCNYESGEKPKFKHFEIATEYNYIQLLQYKHIKFPNNDEAND